MIKSFYNPDENIIYVERYGNIFLNELLDNVHKIDHQYRHLSELYILEDVRNSNSKFTIHDLPMLAEEIKNKAVHYNEIRCALITDSPSNTVLSFVFEELVNQIENYSYKTYSTVDAAKYWLLELVY